MLRMLRMLMLLLLLLLLHLGHGRRDRAHHHALSLGGSLLLVMLVLLVLVWLVWWWRRLLLVVLLVVLLVMLVRREGAHGRVLGISSGGGVHAESRRLGVERAAMLVLLGDGGGRMVDGRIGPLHVRRRHNRIDRGGCRVESRE